MTELRRGARKTAGCLLALSILMGMAFLAAAADEAGDETSSVAVDSVDTGELT